MFLQHTSFTDISERPHRFFFSPSVNNTYPKRSWSFHDYPIRVPLRNRISVTLERLNILQWRGRSRLGNQSISTAIIASLWLKCRISRNNADDCSENDPASRWFHATISTRGSSDSEKYDGCHLSGFCWRRLRPKFSICVSPWISPWKLLKQ